MTLATLFTLLGYFVAVGVLIWAAKKKRMATEGVAWVAMIGTAGGLIVARLVQFLIEGWPNRISFVSFFDPTLGGRALLGGIVGGWIAVEIAKRRFGLKRSTGDLFALALPAGEAVGRIGCHFGGCCYGTEFAGAWAVYQHGALRHPAQLYSAGYAALLFVWLLWMRKRVATEGALFRHYLLGFGAGRFVLEFFRWREHLWVGLSPMQWLCIELIIYAAVWLWLARPKRKVEDHRAMEPAS
ncbi:MAG: hypothetical protein HND42_08025 [Armatimonadetes bacterium]|nr:hypothetical protein [Armatimonadota bacterium]NOG93171.1 hypothetical protein [Armatimonadota bacterium]